MLPSRPIVLLVAILTTSGVSLGRVMPAQAQAPHESSRPTGHIKYEAVGPGVQAAELFRTDALRGVTIEVEDVIVGPGKAIPAVAAGGYAITELKAGEAETTIDGRTVRRRPGDFWVVLPGQTYAVRSLGGLVVLHAVLLTRK